MLTVLINIVLKLNKEGHQAHEAIALSVVRTDAPNTHLLSFVLKFIATLKNDIVGFTTKSFYRCRCMYQIPQY